MSEDLGKLVEDINGEIQGDPRITKDVKDRLSDLNGTFQQGKAVFDLFTLMSRADDPNLSDFDRLRAVKQALDIGRALGPGGALASLMAPFFTFYSTALEEIAVALENIDNMRKETILSTGECSVIDPIIADPARKKAWQDACKLKQLMDRVRDP
jgi:hypothetical protein